MTRESSIRRLLVTWIVGATLLTLTMFLQSAFGKYGADANVALAWLAASFAPTLSLISTAAFNEMANKWKVGPADMNRYRLAQGGSVVYLLAIGLLLLIEPFIPKSPFELFDLAAGWFAIGQAFVVAAITSVIFDKR